MSAPDTTPTVPNPRARNGRWSPPEQLTQVEFIAIMAMLFSTLAFSIDAMLPALPEIAGELSPDAPNRAQLIVTSFMFGLGIGTLFTGPLSDALGRKPVVLGGIAVYLVGAGIAAFAQSLEVLLAARMLQGLGAAGPRIVALAIVRDLYKGRVMARIMSFVMIVFTIVPAFAPTLGAGIIWLAGWRAVFTIFFVFGIIAAVWLAIRQRETLPPENRRPLRPRVLASGVREILGIPLVAVSIGCQALCFGMLFATISSAQQIFDVTFGEGHRFHLWFGLMALLAGPSAFVNASLVERLGMLRIVTTVLGAQVIVTALITALFLFGAVSGPVALGICVAWMTGIFFQSGLVLGNMNALAMEPLGHLAGLGASVIGALSTVGAVILAVPIGLMFDGTPLPLMVSLLVMVALAFGLTRVLAGLTRPA